MYKGTPRTDWHVPMCAGVESAYLPYMLAFNIHLTVFSICLSIYVIHYFIAFLIILYIPLPLSSQHLSPHLIYTV